MISFEVFDGELKCHSAEVSERRSIQDLEAVRCFDKIRLEMPRHRSRLCTPPGTPMQLQEIKLPSNFLGDAATRALVQALVTGTVRVGLVALYKNQLGDAAAQALSVLLELSPPPGVHGLHISHNFFSPQGVNLMLQAAVKCGRYPMRGVPLWLRVEHQQCKWAALAGKPVQEQLKLARLLIGQKEQKLLEDLQARGRVPEDVTIDDTKLLCIPENGTAMRPAWMPGGDPDAEDSGQPADWFSATSPCNSGRCRHASPYGPLVHLPYFWAQNGKIARLPEAATLHVRDPRWRTWRPLLPIASRGARKNASGTAEVSGGTGGRSLDKNVEPPSTLDVDADRSYIPDNDSTAPVAERNEESGGGHTDGHVSLEGGGIVLLPVREPASARAHTIGTLAARADAPLVRMAAVPTAGAVPRSSADVALRSPSPTPSSSSSSSSHDLELEAAEMAAQELSREEQQPLVHEFGSGCGRTISAGFRKPAKERRKRPKVAPKPRPKSAKSLKTSTQQLALENALDVGQVAMPTPPPARRGRASGSTKRKREEAVSTALAMAAKAAAAQPAAPPQDEDEEDYELLD